MEQYIQARFLQERQKLMKAKETLHIDHDGAAFNAAVNAPIQMVKSAQDRYDMLYEVPSHLDVDPLLKDRDAIDKPIQWVAGMMEVPVDPAKSIKTMEKMIQ